MTQETKATFTRRIAQSNPSQLICILYEIYFSYETEALDFLKNEGADSDISDYTKSLRMCGQTVRHLKEALDFTYEIAASLYAIYDFVERSIAKSIYEKNEKRILEIHGIMKSLEESFVELAKLDERAPMMDNTEQVVAGLTYGRNQLNESIEAKGSNRGFFA